MHHPNPAIYRLAAELVANREFGYSCTAIRRAFTDLVPPTEAQKADCAFMRKWYHLCDTYTEQYERMFGPRYPDNPKVHPFWNRYDPSPNSRLVQYRVIALLTMADICENPVE